MWAADDSNYKEDMGALLHAHSLVLFSFHLPILSVTMIHCRVHFSMTSFSHFVALRVPWFKKLRLVYYLRICEYYRDYVKFVVACQWYP